MWIEDRKKTKSITPHRFMAGTYEKSIRILTMYGYQSFDTSGLNSFAMQYL